MTRIVPMQPELRQALPEVIGNIDYKTFRETLLRMEKILADSGLEEEMMSAAVTHAAARRKTAAGKRNRAVRELSCAERQGIQKRSQQAFRCVIARHLVGESYRDFSCRLADSALFQHFCFLDRLGPIQVPSKSRLQRYERQVPVSQIQKVIVLLNEATGQAENKLELAESFSLEALYYDTTCCATNIHFPVDWVLFRDAVRTLMKAVRLIRKAGLKNRMKEPEVFIREMNQLSIRMTQTRRQKAGKKQRKKIVRLMKRLVKKVKGHAEKHRKLLEMRWAETKYSERQARQILKRIDGVVDALPAAIEQVQERMIGERKVRNEKKVLSLYERDTHVIVRGKSGAESEFGNTLLLGEQADGVIVDWKLYREQAPADSAMLTAALDRVTASYGENQVHAVTTDRGFYSEKNRQYLEEKEIGDYMCPRSIPQLTERLTEPIFRAHQKRRGQTEGRIAILRNNFLGRPLRSKGFLHRELSVAWGILAHNLWVISRLPQAEKRKRKKAA